MRCVKGPVMEMSGEQTGRGGIADPAPTERSQGRMEQVITGLVDGILVPVTSLIPVLVSSGIAFVIFAAMWIALGAGLVWNQGGVDAAWAWIGSLPLLVQAVVWLLFLPVVGALWVWESSWPIIV